MTSQQFRGPVGISDQLPAHCGCVDPAAFDRLVDEFRMAQIPDADHRFAGQRFDLIGKFQKTTFRGKRRMIRGRILCPK